MRNGVHKPIADMTSSGAEPLSFNFEQKANLPQGISDQTATLITLAETYLTTPNGLPLKGKGILLLGGCDEQQFFGAEDFGFFGCTSTLSNCSIYDVDEDNYYACESMPSARSRFCTVQLASDGKVYVLGGRDASDNVVKEIDVYDPAKNSWTTLDGELPDGEFSSESMKNKKKKGHAKIGSNISH